MPANGIAMPPPTEGSKRCLIYQGYKGPSQEVLDESLEDEFLECGCVGWMVCYECDPRVTYLLACLTCAIDPPLPILFESAEARGKWAAAHTEGTGHSNWIVEETRRE